MLALLVITLLGAAVPLRALRARVAVRVSGSWVAAAGMLMLGGLVRETG